MKLMSKHQQPWQPLQSDNIRAQRPEIITPIKRVAHPGNKLITIGG